MYVPYAGDTKDILNSYNAVYAAFSAAVSQIVKHFKGRGSQSFCSGFSKLNLKNG